MAESFAPTQDSAPVRPVRVGPMEVETRSSSDGAIYVRSKSALGPYPARITDRLEHWAALAPDRTFVAQRQSGGDWRRVSYAETFRLVRSLAQMLIDRGLSAERPLAILSGNDIDHALLALAALHAGVAYSPISPAYSLVSTGYERLRGIFDLLKPGLVFVSDGAAFQAALNAVVPRETEVVAARCSAGGRERPLAPLLETAATAAVERAAALVGPDTVAKFLFTSGSTGRPKAVINTHRMLCSNQQMMRQCFAFLQDEPPVLVDWSPWNHTAGGNHNFGLVLYNGGTLYIDEGKPTPAGAAETARNLREIAPTWYFNVPKGYEALLPHLQSDPVLRQNFFSRVKMLYVAGAGLSQAVWNDINRAAVDTCGEQILLTSGLGATETAPFALVCTWQQKHSNNCGLPAPDVELKLAPAGGKLEARMRGPNITPGYWREPALTAAAFDEEGFYRLGDAMRPADPSDLRHGLLFDGRIAENFKLATGTWVSVDAIRSRFLDRFRPYASDVVITGLNRDYVGAMIFPNPHACRELVGANAESNLADIVADRRVVDVFAKMLRSLGASASGSSNRVERALLLDTPPSVEAGEVTDKGSVNQRGVVERRAAAVERLYTDPPAVDVIVAKERAP